MKDTVLFYKSFYDAIKMLPTIEQRYRAIEIIYDYAFENKEPEEKENGMEMIIFKMAKPLIDSNIRNYENGKKGGRPPKNSGETNDEKPPDKPPVMEKSENEKPPDKTPLETPVKTPEKPNVNVNDNVNVNENANANSHFTFTSYTYREGEGEPLPPPSDEGGPAPSPFTRTDVKACAANPVNGINLSPEQIQGFYDWMEKYNWTINGEPVTNLVRALRGFQKREDKKAENSTAEKTEDEFYLQRFSDADVADEIMQKYENDIFSFCKNKFDMERIVNKNFDLSQDEYNGYEVDDYLTKDFKPKGFLKKQIFLEWLYYSYAEGALLPALTTKEKNKIFQVVCYKGYAEKKEIVENRKKSQEKEKAQAIS